jgi:hypothetical protein
MAPKAVDPDDVYIVRELFACGEGHFMCPGFTHWETGEACPMGHASTASNEDVHLYLRKIMVPEFRVGRSGAKSWENMNARENAGKWGQLPLAPAGLSIGTRIDGRGST